MREVVDLCSLLRCDSRLSVDPLQVLASTPRRDDPRHAQVPRSAHARQHDMSLGDAVVPSTLAEEGERLERNEPAQRARKDLPIVGLPPASLTTTVPDSSFPAFAPTSCFIYGCA
jgi:hypothetical protein